MIIVERIRDWSTRTFVGQTQGERANKLLEEACELAKAPHDLTEMADVFIVLMTMIPSWPALLNAVVKKMAQNVGRSWRRLPEGGWRHE